MADLLANAASWLAQQRTKHLTQQIVYRRETLSVTVPATVGKTEFEVDDEFGVVQRIESRDFLILTSDLILDGTVTIPERGDVVEEQAGTQTLQYEVNAPGKEPCWRYSDLYRQTLRIHTKATGTS
ncbi:hypothetical protein [Thalassoglobus sp.]|uniref:hypothetical protein n=1 Tax=Thalassoglobus sp. TaxID=2795869 RepID=UPI003AA92AEB